MECKAISIIVVMSMIFSLHVTYAATFTECENADAGAFVKSTESCQTYIYCDDESSYSGDCDAGQYFDGESCDDAENVYCALDAQENPEEPNEPDEPEEPQEPQESELPVEPVTSAPMTATTTVLPHSISSSGDNTIPLEAIAIAPVVRDQCPAIDDPQQIVLMTNAQSCTDYFLCYHGHPIEMRCTDNLHFNIHSAKCDFPENVQCMLDRPKANKCLPHVTDFFPHPQNCNYFYYCIKGYLTLQQCPFYYGWDIERRACVLIKQAKCFEGSKET